MRLRFADIVTINCPTPRSAPMKKTMTSVLLAAGMAAAGAGLPKTLSAQPIVVTPIPAQVPAKEGFADIPDTRLWYWDTGGTGTPIVLLHPATGSGLIWGYQQPVLAKAGYRVIGYSRRGYINSAPFDRSTPGVGSEDLRALADHLGLGRFHLVASAAAASRPTSRSPISRGC